MTLFDTLVLKNIFPSIKSTSLYFELSRRLARPLSLNGPKQDGVAAGGKWTPPNLAIVERIAITGHCDSAECATSILFLSHELLKKSRNVQLTE
jgi:hypothetical protein